MGFLRAVCRILVGVIFILSGFLKMADPVGNGLKITEYLQAFHMGWLDFASLWLGILLSGAEFLIGAALLKGLRMRLFTTAALGFLAFFTALTFVSALFDPVSDCGCFGEAVHLTNWQTFWKNVVLLAASLLLFFQRDKFVPIAGKKWEIGYLAGYGLLILGVGVTAKLYLPFVDFGPYKSGTDLTLTLGSGEEREYRTVLIYTKGGEEREFDIEHLPDSTWQFKDARTELISGKEPSSSSDFILKNASGSYLTENILKMRHSVFLISFYETGRIDASVRSRIERLYAALSAADPEAHLFIVSGNSPEQTAAAMGERLEGLGIPVLYTDYKTVLTLNRSNGGLTWLFEGSVVKKWAFRDYPFRQIDRLAGEDPELIMARTEIGSRLFAEFFLIFVFLLIAIVRLVSKFLYKRKEEADLPGEGADELPETNVEK